MKELLYTGVDCRVAGAKEGIEVSVVESPAKSRQMQRSGEVRGVLARDGMEINR